MFARAVQNSAKPTSAVAGNKRPLVQQKPSTLNMLAAPNKKRKVERTLSTASSNLGALHQAVYFDENDFDDDVDLDLSNETPVKKTPAVTYPSLERALSEMTPAVQPEPVQQQSLSSSAPVPWSSSPPEHFQRPVPRPAPKRRTVPWLEDHGDTKDDGDAKDAAVTSFAEEKVTIGGKDASVTSFAKEDVTLAGNDTTVTPLAKEKDALSGFPWDQTASALKAEQKAARKRNRGLKPVEKEDTGVKKAQQPTNATKVPRIFLSNEQKAILKTVVDEEKSVFFTGSAGTGKSVLMRQIIQQLKAKYKKHIGAVAVTASTGLAACNIEGSTVHSFAGIGLGKDPAPQLVRKIKRNAKFVNRWRQCKVLVVDEISMVDGDLYDKLEFIGRSIKGNGRPFGGIQLVVTGDFFQLPPVPEGNKAAKFCFDAETWTTTIQHTILLTHIFRQKDPTFATMLNEMRLGRLSAGSISAFQQLSRPLSFDDEIDATELFPLRREVEAANSSRMRNLSGQTFTFNAKDTPGRDAALAQKAFDNMMAPSVLEFKKGAQVMLIKNMDDSLVNGSLGKIQAFMTKGTHSYWKENEDDFEEIWGGKEDEAKQQRKQEIRAAINVNRKDSDEFEDNVHYPLVRFSLPDGTFRTLLCVPEDWKVEGNTEKDFVAIRRQVPLILAWALSIHKAQGQTLERVKVNLARVFERGQAYVALSRATSQSGLQVTNFNASKVMVHPKVVDFYQKLQNIDAITAAAREQKQGKKMISAEEYERKFVELEDEDEDELYMYE